jgi:hypothetical protein
MSEIWIDRNEFIAGQEWKWEPNDSDHWVFDSNDNKIKQYDPNITGVEGTVTDLGTTTFTYELLGETNSSPYMYLCQYNI